MTQMASSKSRYLGVLIEVYNFSTDHQNHSITPVARRFRFISIFLFLMLQRFLVEGGRWKVEGGSGNTLRVKRKV